MDRVRRSGLEPVTSRIRVTCVTAPLHDLVACFINTVAYIDQLLSNDRETNEITTIARQQLRKYATVLEPVLGSDPRATMEVMLEWCFLCSPLRDYITRPTEFSSVSAAEYSGAKFSSVTVSCCCYKLVAQARG
jgi:hypothetical protein